MVFCSLVSDMMNIRPLSCISKFTGFETEAQRNSEMAYLGEV